MKYLVNRETKEHIKIDGFLGWYDQSIYDLVEADAEGWISWTSPNECPVRRDAHFQMRYTNGSTSDVFIGSKWGWATLLCDNATISHYRPILDKPTDADNIKIPEPDFSKMKVGGVMYYHDQGCGNLLDRLKSAHEAAASIPDLLAELRGVLEPMGYDLVARDPFVESEQSIETTKDDMSDWRNWREGDLIECIDAEGWGRFKEVILYKVTEIQSDHFELDGYEVFLHQDDFRFHSRPERE